MSTEPSSMTRRDALKLASAALVPVVQRSSAAKRVIVAGAGIGGLAGGK